MPPRQHAASHIVDNLGCTFLGVKLLDRLLGQTPVTEFAQAAAVVNVPVGTAATSEGALRELDPVAAVAFGINLDGGPVTRQVALQIPTIRRGRNMICGTVGSLPLVAFRRPADGTPWSTVDRRLFAQLDPRCTPSHTLQMTVDDLLFRDVAWWRVTERDTTGYPVAIERLAPERVQVQPETSESVGRVLVDGKEAHDRDLIRFDGPGDGGLLANGGPVIRLALSLIRGAKRTADDDVPTGKLTLREGATEPSNEPGSATDGSGRSQVEKMLDDWEAARAARTTAYLNSAIDYETVASTAQQRQLSELSDMVATDLARLLNLPASRVNAPQGSGMTYTNTEADRRDLVDVTLTPYLAAIEQRLSMGDVTPSTQGVMFDLTGYVRGTTQELVTAGAAAVAAGLASREEVRTRWLGLPPGAPELPSAPGAGEAPASTPTASARRLQMVTANGTVGVDHAARTISGLVVPFGLAGHTSSGRLTWASGADLRISSPRRVKLLREHDQTDSLGAGVTFEALTAAEVDARMTAAGLDPLGVPGLWATFAVAPGPNGDRALAEAESGVRDAFSVGVELDDATLTALASRQGHEPIAAAGQLREVSLVSVPAYDDARVAAGAQLTVSAWEHIATAATPSSPAAPTTERNTTTMSPEQQARLLELQTRSQGGETLTDAEQQELDALQALAAVYPPTGGTPPPAEPAAASTAVTTAAGTATASGPTVIPAVAGTARTTSEPSVYAFAGAEGNSIVTDLLRAHLRGDGEAGERVARFNAQLAGGNPGAVQAFVTAAATRTDIDGAGTDLPSMFQPNPNRPDLMRALVDVKRPFISRLNTVPITNAQPFSIPEVGEFTGVGPHTEGTPHRAAGTLTLGGDTVTPTATSGAWEASRELIDASNPVLDQIAARAMLRDYQRQTEGKIVTLLAARAAQAGAVLYGVDTLIDLRTALIDFVNDDEEAADLVGISKALLKDFGAELDDVSRPQLPFVGPANAQGTIQAGFVNLSVDGVDVFRAARLDAGLAAADPSDGPVVGAKNGVMARSEGILWCESNVLQFRFDEVLGPGVIKLALWAYSGAAILDTADVKIISAAAPS